MIVNCRVGMSVPMSMGPMLVMESSQVNGTMYLGAHHMQPGPPPVQNGTHMQPSLMHPHHSLHGSATPSGQHIITSSMNRSQRSAFKNPRKFGNLCHRHRAVTEVVNVSQEHRSFRSFSSYLKPSKPVITFFSPGSTKSSTQYAIQPVPFWSRLSSCATFYHFCSLILVFIGC